MRPIRVLYFMGTLGTGGSEIHLLRLLEAIDRGRVAPSVLLVTELGDSVERVRKLGIPVDTIGSEPGPKGFARSIPRITRHLRSLKPDVLHMYGYTPQLYGTIGSLFARPHRVIAARRGDEVGRRKHWLYRLTNPLVHEVLCVSEATERFSRETERLSPAKSRVIPNGLDLQRFPTRPGPQLRVPLERIGTVGRLRDIKGSDLLLDAFAQVRSSRPGIELHVGGPADTAWGEELVRSRSLDPGVTFHGKVDSATFLPTLDLFVLPSRSEGMSNALIEAMATGLPLIATDVGGNSEVLDGGRCGRLTHPTAESLAAAIAELLDDPNQASRYASAARARAEAEYDLQVMVERYMSYYEELLGR